MSAGLDKKISLETVKEHGLSEDEYQNILEILGREPSLTELGVFSVMWSEHCSYKSSLKWLKTLHISGKQVIQGPGENAGVVDIGDNQAIIFKMESHNHPSFIEPYQGAATGVGGILRDVFTMGARPIALMNALRFGEVDNEKTPHLLSGVVEGIAGYGNCMGIPTIGGEVNFHASYNGNILVNAMCIGLVEQDKIFYCAATGVGNPIIYVGSKTGRDGIHGATMASAEFADDSQEKRPTVQVGDPFTEKLLLEACLELMQKDVIIGIQDMGAAGLTSSSVEMADKGNVGIVIDLDKVPCRETQMSAYEMLLSESQERMLMVLKPGSEDEARAIFEKWDLNFEVIGHTTNTNHFVAQHNGEVMADIPLAGLASAAPCYDRPWEIVNNEEEIDLSLLIEPSDYCATLIDMLKSPDIASRRAIWEQYDHMVMGDTIQRPGGDSGVVRIFETKKGLAISTDCTPRYCYANPYEGGKQAVVETYRNIIASGAKPLSITNCLNFGNPERKEVMGQFVGVINGIRDACKELDYPVVSGNVSLYNETNGQAILPTPTIGGIGLIQDIDKMVDIKIKNEGDILFVLGEEKAEIGQSLYLREIHNIEKGLAPRVELETEHRLGKFMLKLIGGDYINAAHDISDGGLYVAIAEMVMASKIGADIKLDNLSNEISGKAKSHILYGEEQGRYIVGVARDNLNKVIDMAKTSNIPCRFTAIAVGDKLSIEGKFSLSINEMIEANAQLIPELLSF